MSSGNGITGSKSSSGKMSGWRAKSGRIQNKIIRVCCSDNGSGCSLVEDEESPAKKDDDNVEEEEEDDKEAEDNPPGQGEEDNKGYQEANERAWARKKKGSYYKKSAI